MLIFCFRLFRAGGVAVLRAGAAPLLSSPQAAGTFDCSTTRSLEPIPIVTRTFSR